VRNRGTIGGSLANNDPAADYPAAVLALGATLATTKRTIVADDFFRGLFATALAENEILTEIAFPIRNASPMPNSPIPHRVSHLLASLSRPTQEACVSR